MHNSFLIDQGKQEVKAIEVIVVKDVVLLVVVLSHDNLLGAEEGSEAIVEIHFLDVACGVMADPKILGVGLESDAEGAEGE